LPKHLLQCGGEDTVKEGKALGAFAPELGLFVDLCSAGYT